MNITVLGAGRIGGTLGKKWAAKGHKVEFGVRDPEADKIRNVIVESGAPDQCNAVLVEEAGTEADVVVIAVPSSALPDTVSKLPQLKEEVILIDTTNDFSRHETNKLSFLREKYPGATLFRAFNSLGWQLFNHPIVDEKKVDHFFCGMDQPGGSAEKVGKLIADIGLRPLYIGGMDKAFIADSLGHLWVQMAYSLGYGPEMAYKMVSNKN